MDMRRKVVAMAVLVIASSGCAEGGSVAPIATLAGSDDVAAWRESSRSIDVTTGSPFADSTESQNDDLRIAFERLMSTRIRCGHEPRECELDELAAPDSSVHVALAEVFEERSKYGIVASERGSHRYRIEGATMLAPDRGEVRVCHTDDVVLVIGATPGRPAAIFDETLVSHWSTWTLQKVDETWLWSDERIERRIYGEDQCSS